MPASRSVPRLSVILDADQKAALKSLARKASFDSDVDITVSDLVRDAIELFLAQTPETHVSRIAESKTQYRT